MGGICNQSKVQESKVSREERCASLHETLDLWTFWTLDFLYRCALGFARSQRFEDAAIGRQPGLGREEALGAGTSGGVDIRPLFHHAEHGIGEGRGFGVRGAAPTARHLEQL